jgi:hypothetical protein
MLLLAILLALILGSGQSTPLNPAADSPTWLAEYCYSPDEVVDFTFGANGAPLVPVVHIVVQGETIPVIFDTGTAGYGSLDDKLIERLKLPVKSWATWFDSSGAEVGKVPLAIAPELRFGPIRLNNVEIVGMGPESIMGKANGFSGTVGWWMFRDYRVTVDYASRKIALSRSPLPPKIKSCATRYIAPFVSPTNLPGLVLIEGDVDGQPIYLELDTGKSSTVLDPKIKSIRKFTQEESGYIIDGIHVGPFEVKSRFGRMFVGLQGLGKGLPRPVYVGLGSDFLQQFRATIDYPHRQVVLEQSVCK